MDEKLNELLSVIRNRFKDATVYLFGSRAKKTHRTDSGYDLIISQSFEKTPFVDRSSRIWKHAEHGFAADLLCYTPEEFDAVSKTSSTIQNAMRHAVRV